jgi:S-(hydroxymethyl)glutathione dehydrogenase/alcohol dehydrogenase
VRAGQVVPAAGLVAAQAALIGCAVSTGYGVVRNVAKVRAGDRVAVFGIGGIGVNVLQTCRLQRASRIIALDTDARREDLAYRFGATDFVTVPRGADRSATAALGARHRTARRRCGNRMQWRVVSHRSGHRGARSRRRRGAGRDPRTGARSSFGRRRAVSAVDASWAALNGRRIPTVDLADIVALARDGALDLADKVTRVWPLDESTTRLPRCAAAMSCVQ